MIPVFRTIYAPVKQLVAFSPDNEYGFKRVVMVEDPNRGWVMGFLTKEFTVTRAGVSETMAAVYVPTNHYVLWVIYGCIYGACGLSRNQRPGRDSDFSDRRDVVARSD